MMVASATPRELADARSVEPLGRSEPSWIPVGALDAVPSALLPRTRNLASLILALTLSALIFAGAGVQPASAATASHKLKAGDLYVSLGSSIASGYGISVQSTSCGRSSRDYGQLVAKHFRLHLVDASCGAAVIPNVLDTPQGSNPPQLTFVTPATKLVTFAVGGNDIVYNGTAAECDNPTTCAIPTNFAAMVATMRANLKVMIDKIKAAAPSATIVFVTYPREVPAGNCPALGFTNSGAAVVRSMGQTLEKMPSFRSSSPCAASSSSTPTPFPGTTLFAHRHHSSGRRAPSTCSASPASPTTQRLSGTR